MTDRDLFISHSSADAAAARALVDDLERGGIRCWVAPRDVPMGSAYQVEIVAAIERCRAMLLVFSDNANKSEHILREIELAAQSRKPIYPVRFDGAVPAGGLKYMLANKQWVERQTLGDRLIETIGQLLGREGGAVTVVVSRPQPRRLLLLAGAGVAACLLLVAAWVAFEAPWKRAPQVKEAAVVEQSPPSTPAPAPPAQPAVVQAPNPSAQPPVAAPPTPAAPQPATAAPASPDPPAQSAPPAQTPDPPRETSVVARLPTGEAQGHGAPAPVIRTTAPSDPGALKGVNLFRECDVCPIMAVIPAGRALIGAPEGEPSHAPAERPQQEVNISQPFAVGRSEISFEEWLACVAEGGCNAYRPGDYGWGYGKRPAINVSWKDAKAYVEWLSRKTGASYRLLTEAEWEYAARGCTTPCPLAAFWFGKISPDQANYDWRFSYEGSPKAMPPRRTFPADEALPNPFGLMHMHGNVREWVEDCWNASLARLPRDGTAQIWGDCLSRVVRGGSWADEPKDLRAAKRSWEVLGERRAQIGFRVARDLR